MGEVVVEVREWIGRMDCDAQRSRMLEDEGRGWGRLEKGRMRIKEESKVGMTLGSADQLIRCRGALALAAPGGWLF